MSTRRRIVDEALYVHFVTFSVDRRRKLLDHDHSKRIILGVWPRRSKQHLVHMPQSSPLAFTSLTRGQPQDRFAWQAQRTVQL